MALQDIHHYLVRYSQISIERTFRDRQTPVETWIDQLPYSLPLEVAPIDGEYFLSLHNRRLYSAKTYSPNITVSCIVHQFPTELMRDHCLDLLEVLWADSENSLKRLSLRANTIEGVMMIRCVTQNTSFPILGRLEPAPSLGARIYDPEIWKKRPASINFAQSKDNYLESVVAAAMILVCIKITVNVYHRRDDLREVLLNPELFQAVNYERSTDAFTLRARGEKKTDTWDDWDDLFSGLSEAEAAGRDEYEIAFFESLKVS